MQSTSSLEMLFFHSPLAWHLYNNSHCCAGDALNSHSRVDGFDGIGNIHHRKRLICIACDILSAYVDFSFCKKQIEEAEIYAIVSFHAKLIFLLSNSYVYMSCFHRYGGVTDIVCNFVTNVAVKAFELAVYCLID